MEKFTVSVPATTANLGPGFDCLGAALDLCNLFHFVPLPDRADGVVEMTIEGKEAAGIAPSKDNLLYQSMARLAETVGRSLPAVAITIELKVPLARGLGSSATAIVGGLLGANQLLGNPCNAQEIRDLAIAIEGHPDNVVPALLGGCQMTVGETGQWQVVTLPWHPELLAIVAIPDFELSTEEARSVLPQTYSRSDAIFNLTRTGLLIKALETHNPQWLGVALSDRLHQPYRQQLIKGYGEMETTVKAAGGYGMVISGAGPTLLALTDAAHRDQVIASMAETWRGFGVNPTVCHLPIHYQGAQVLR